MIKQYQVTLTCESGKYRPVSAIVKAEAANLSDKTQKKNIINKGIEKICIQRYWGNRELCNYGYTKVRIREYDKEKIEKENKERYEKIKEEHYQNGTWKRPKEK